MQTRATAAQIINDVVVNRHSLTKLLERIIAKEIDSRNRAMLQDLCFGVLRWYQLLERYLEQLIEKPIKPKDAELKQLLLIGLYQIIYQQTPNHAAVSECVNACDDLKKTWAKKLVNAVLRRFIREQESIENKLHSQDSFSHPAWLIKQLKSDWPEQFQNILNGNQLQAPLTLRINQTKISRDDYLNTLEHASIEATETKHSLYGIHLNKSIDIKKLPGYEEGLFSVQDEAAQFAAILLDIEKDQRVLDACAAPGGKTTHCLESQVELTELIALDNNPQRIKRVEENLNRLSLEATTIVGDASKPNIWWDNKLFDRILLDVPCTASGIIRRHPDIKFLRQEQDIAKVISEQTTLLENIWPLLKPNGKLLYSTCSVFKAENDQQIQLFLKQHEDAQLKPIDVTWGNKTQCGVQVFPGQDNMDGFYYSCIIKT